MLQTVAQALLRILQTCINVVRAVLGVFEHWLRGALSALHVSGSLQTILVTLLPILLLVAVVRLLGGVVRVFVALALVLLVVEILTPALGGR